MHVSYEIAYVCPVVCSLVFLSWGPNLSKILSISIFWDAVTKFQLKEILGFYTRSPTLSEIPCTLPEITEINGTTCRLHGG